MKRILILGRASRSTNLLMSVLLQQDFDVFFIEERRDDKIKLLMKRVNRLGFFIVFSQLLFLIVVRALAKLQSTKKRLTEIENDLIAEIKTVSATYIFNNINSTDSLKAINNTSPDCIILSGTRILSSEFLAQVKCPILNIHAGINPAYRGVHGGYWALANKQSEYFGSTIHLVDEGVDTGAILVHAITEPSTADNFVTYPLLQMSTALKTLPSVLNDIFLNQANVFVPSLPSLIWSHPTIWQYISNRFRYGVK